ncbi:nuclear transport factor 2 family protein [Mucilaginibacter sp. Bleaf8]|uniref:nuclear transport factor 2 family protein n=1 Tax=Mucilaginibacter sp. Bleaf8 TaxID=2834430 RepID=UPI001BD0BD2C|nr:nuclear transport factor 2 family protein [Mucilaginibacter sp. Bleaf8]MBS7564970.1 nuclear transport factor 2 family protein [Mucilaginibacter sp. Bleaf8]
MDNKAVLLNANDLITQGDNEGFLSFCTEDTEWEFVGDKTLKGKQAVREYMETAYLEPPKFDVEKLIAGEDFVTAIGKISLKNESGKVVDYAYCDVWQFRDGKLDKLKAFVVETGSR